MIHYQNNKLELRIGKNEYKFDDFIQVINQIVTAIYSIYIEDKEEYNMIFDNNLEILMKKTKDNNTLECLLDEEKNNINLQILLYEINDVCEGYFTTHSIDNEINFKYDKYQKIKDLFRRRNSYE